LLYPRYSSFQPVVDAVLVFGDRPNPEQENDMARTRTKKNDAPTESQIEDAEYEARAEEAAAAPSVSLTIDPALQLQASEVIHGLAESLAMPEAAKPAPSNNGYAAAVERKKYTQAPDPFGVEAVTGDGNSVRLLRSNADRAWVIRFEKNPNDMTDEQGVKYSKERPHPVLKALKESGFRWGFADADGQGGWGKLMQEGHYTYAEHLDARKVLAKAAEMIGVKVGQGQIPD
jgi:hypothetical protein